MKSCPGDGQFVCDELSQARFKAKMLEADNAALRTEVSNWIDQFVTQRTLAETWAEFANRDNYPAMALVVVMTLLTALYCFWLGVKSADLF